MPTTFVTGFPGFLGSALLPRLLRREPEMHIACLVQRRWAGTARERLALLAREEPDVLHRVRLVEGDLTRPGAGLTDGGDVLADVTDIFHLAAVYDLAVGKETAEAVNVEGTRRMVELARRAPRLARLHHVSTCYVSGTHRGVFTEEDLDVGQRFKNHYEETKYRSEVVVREAMEGEGLPATVYRPAVVVGDSGDGATQKMDGPYLFIRFLMRQPGPVRVMPVTPDFGRLRTNIVPRDFVADALARLSALEESAGQTYHLADPRPESPLALLHLIGAAMGVRVIPLPLPFQVIRTALALPGATKLTGIPPEAVAYYRHRGTYDVTRAQAHLAKVGVACPPVRDYLPRMVDFALRHPHVSAKAMV